MKKSNFISKVFICILLVGVVFGFAWFFRGTVRVWWNERTNADIPIAISRVEIEKKLQASTSSMPVQVSPSSSKKVSVTSSKFIASSTIQSPSVLPSTSSSVPVAAEIPDSINLAVPFVPQAPEKNWEQPWQDACEEAAILMMDAYENDKTVSLDLAKHDILAMVKWEEDLGWDRSIEMEKIQKIFTDYLKGYRVTTPTPVEEFRQVKIVKNPTVDQIKKYIVSGKPVLVVASGKLLPNPHFQNGGPDYHALVIRGYTKDSFITNDPGTQFGQNYKYKYSDLMNAIHDWNAGDVLTGQRVVMVIE